MNDKQFQFLKQLNETPGVPGREERVRELVISHTKGWWDEQYTDAIGNFVGIIRAKGPLPAASKGKAAAAKGKSATAPPPAREKGVVIACHLDQIGFYVRYVDDEGFLRIHPVGGFDPRNLFACRVQVVTSSGETLTGILNPAVKPIHVATMEERGKIPTVAEFAVDLCLPVEVVKKKVRPGDPVTLEQDTMKLGKMVTGQCMDNRIAPWVALEAISRCKGKNIYDIYFLASTQEEVGIRGAQVAAQQIDAEIGIAIDVTLAIDTPGSKKEEHITRLGEGAAIKVLDSSAISTRSLFEEFVATAEKHKIKFQYEVLPLGGTDQMALQLRGRPRRTITLSVPCRYIHTIVETVHEDDLDACAELLAKWLMGG